MSITYTKINSLVQLKDDHPDLFSRHSAFIEAELSDFNSTDYIYLCVIRDSEQPRSLYSMTRHTQTEVNALPVKASPYFDVKVDHQTLYQQDFTNFDVWMGVNTQ